MLIWRRYEHHNTFILFESESHLEAGEGNILGVLESCRRIAKPNVHFNRSIKSLERNKGSQVLFIIFGLDLPLLAVGVLEIKTAALPSE